VGSRAKQEQAGEEWEMVSKAELNRMGILSSDCNWLIELVVQFVDPLVDWEVLMLDMADTVSPVKHEIIAHNQHEELNYYLQSIWNSLRVGVHEFELPV